MTEFRSIVTVGKSRGTRLRQARQHTQVLRDKFASVRGWAAEEVIADPDFWQSTRETLDKLVQCFHEAAAFNAVMDDHILIDDVEYNLTEAGARSIAERMPNCTNCQDTNWVCESHPDRPWDKDLPNGCVCNAGMPCPVCGGDFKEDKEADH